MVQPPEDKDPKDKTWQEIAESKKPLSQKAIELLDDPTKQFMSPKQEKVVEKQIKIKAQPDPTHTVVTQLSAPRPITSSTQSPSQPKKSLKASITQQESRKLTPEELNNLKQMQSESAQSIQEKLDEDDDPVKALKDAAKQLLNIFSKKKP